MKSASEDAISFRKYLLPPIAEHINESIIGAAETISKEGRSISWANISTLLGLPSSTIRDSAGRAGVGTIQEIQDFILDGSQQVLQDVISTGKVREKLDMIINEENGNNTVGVTSVSSKNKTIASVVKQCQVDLDLYEIVSPKVRKWDVPIKQKDADGSTRLEIVECYYIGFSLVLKSSIHIISPIVAHIKFAPPVTMRSATPDRKSFGNRAQIPNSTSAKNVVSKRTVVLADPQIGYRKNHITNELVPFHDRKALDVALQITRQINPDTVVINGDWLDMSEWSDKFTREPGFFFTTQPALFETHYWLQKLRRTLPKARIVYIEGNHEVRLRNSIVNHLASLATLVDVKGESIGSLATLLGLESLGIEYLGGYPNNYLDLGPIVVAHGHLVRGKSQDTVAAILQRIDKSHLVGHIHRPEMGVKTVSLSGCEKEIFAMSSGCLCRTDYVVPGHQRGSVWQQGFVVLETSENLVTPYQIPIRNGQAIFGGNVFSSAFDISELNGAGFCRARRVGRCFSVRPFLHDARGKENERGTMPDHKNEERTNAG